MEYWGLTFFAGKTLLLDIGKRRLEIGSVGPLSDFPIAKFRTRNLDGLILIPVSLPNAVNTFVILDTGADSQSDFIFYEDSLSGITLEATSTTKITDATREVQLMYNGTIPFVRIGGLDIHPASVSVRPPSTENPMERRIDPGC